MGKMTVTNNKSKSNNHKKASNNKKERKKARKKTYTFKSVYVLIMKDNMYIVIINCINIILTRPRLFILV